MKLLCISTEPEAHLPLLQQHLSEQIVVFDPLKFPDDNDITFLWDTISGSFKVYSRGIEISAFDGVWYRKPRLLEPEQIQVEKIYQPFVHSAYSNTFYMLLGLIRDKPWINSYWAIKIASNKLLQLEIANSLGLRIPETLVTTSSDAVNDFIRSQEGQLITKMAGTKHVADEENSYVFYTSELAKFPDLSGLKVAPAIFQPLIDKAMDLRVTVVGERVFACEVHQHGRYSNVVDWREGIFEKGALTYCKHDGLPYEIGVKCVAMLKRFGLVFGAFDFILDKVGRYWFIELNPNGQWGFVEEETGLPISLAFIDMFRKDGT